MTEQPPPSQNARFDQHDQTTRNEVRSVAWALTIGFAASALVAFLALLSDGLGGAGILLAGCSFLAMIGAVSCWAYLGAVWLGDRLRGSRS
jgi:hypothetical protein